MPLYAFIEGFLEYYDLTTDVNMNKFLFLLVSCFCSFNFAVPLQDHKLDLNAISQLGRALGFPQDGDLIAETQKRWLRKPHQEAWEVEELSVEQKLLVLNWAKEQGLYAPWKPALKEYEKALILGASTAQMQKRLAYLQLFVRRTLS